MIDISMAGAVVSIQGSGITVSNITEFSDDNPISVSDLEVAGSSMNLNGELITWYKPSPIEVSLSLLPNSESDRKLKAFIRAVSIGGKEVNVADAYISALTITVPILAENRNGSTAQATGKCYTFTNGRILRGNPAISSDGEGRAQSSGYSFIFEGCKVG